nr:unnamed protein product [Digitaria exilis]
MATRGGGWAHAGWRRAAGSRDGEEGSTSTSPSPVRPGPPADHVANAHAVARGGPRHPTRGDKRSRGKGWGFCEVPFLSFSGAPSVRLRLVHVAVAQPCRRCRGHARTDGASTSQRLPVTCGQHDPTR